MSHATLQRMLKYPHAAAFDPSPRPELALRVRNPAGLTWQVTGSVLRLVTGDSLVWDGSQTFDGNYDWGITARDYSLDGKTVGQLADELRADGHDLVFENAELASRGARVLIAGTGDQDTSNGDHIHAYTSLMWCLFDAYGVEVDEAGHQVDQALRQMVLTQAEGFWLDVWAGLYGVPRLPGETDASLRVRIPKEVFRLRVNGLAIEQAVTELVSETVVIDEPWKRMFHLSGSALSGVDHLHDGHYYTYHVIQPVGVPGTDWAAVMPVLEHNKAAGIEIFVPRIDYATRHVVLQPPVEYLIQTGQVDIRGAATLGTNDQILGVMRLSDNEIIVNHEVARHDWWTLSEPDGLQTIQQIEPHRTIAMASIALSDGPLIGDENFILSRAAMRVDFDPVPMPSDDMMLSNYVATTVVEIVDLVTIDAQLFDAASTFTASGEYGHTDTRAFATEGAYVIRSWTGGWDAGSWVADWRYAGVTRTDTPA
jgi:hypothetical protein